MCNRITAGALPWESTAPVGTPWHPLAEGRLPDRSSSMYYYSVESVVVPVG